MFLTSKAVPLRDAFAPFCQSHGLKSNVNVKNSGRNNGNLTAVLRAYITFCVSVGKCNRRGSPWLRRLTEQVQWKKKTSYMSDSTYSEISFAWCYRPPRSGCPSTTSGKANEIRELLQSDRSLTIRDIALKVGLNTSTVHSIVTRELGMSQVLCSLDTQNSNTWLETSKDRSQKVMS